MIKSNTGILNKKVLYAQAIYGEEEKQAVLKSMENGWLASGPLVKEFENQIANLFGKKYGIAVNSGSSANLLALAALKELYKGKNVITPACTFSTTVSSILLNNLNPVFVDSVIGRYTINEDEIEAKIDENTMGILVPQLIGGVCDMTRLKEIADKHNIFLFDDSCDTLAPIFKGKTCASYADCTTTSFYGSHIITAMGFGGMIVTDNEKIVEIVTRTRDWGRFGDDKEAFEKRFDFTIDDIPYDGKFLYGSYGYNLKLNEGGAAFGLEQLKRLPLFLKKRNQNFHELLDVFKEYEKYFYLPYLIEGAQTNWLSFALTIKQDAPFTRYDILKHFEEHGIQTRVLFSGNITRHPIYRSFKEDFKQADHIMKSGFLLGCHQGMGESEILLIKEALKSFISKQTKL